MNKKGFTLIELLAVIVILAIIVLVATPTILGVIEKSKKEATKQSAIGYIDAVEKQISINELDSSNIKIPDDKYNVSDKMITTTTIVPEKNFNIGVKGKTPNSGYITITKSKVTQA